VSEPRKEQLLTRDFDGNIETGFQIATYHGPLCAEPMEGMAFFVESVQVDQDGVGKEMGMFLL
jgi:ribosome assembly protein 1